MSSLLYRPSCSSLPFHPPGASTSSSRSLYVSPSPTLFHVPPSSVVDPKSLPLNYLDSDLRYVVGFPPVSPVLSSSESPSSVGGDVYADNESANPDTENDKYAVPILLDARAQALRARYGKACERASKNGEGGDGGLRRKNELLKAGCLAYYPGRDKWLKEWQRERMYAPHKPQMHDCYGDFLTGRKNAEWLDMDSKKRAQMLIHEKTMK